MRMRMKKTTKTRTSAASAVLAASEESAALEG
jgi:hypothetical protein